MLGKSEIINEVQNVFNEADLMEIWDAVRDQVRLMRTAKANQAKRKLSVGDQVRFTSRDSVAYEGEISKINRTRALVDLATMNGKKVEPHPWGPKQVTVPFSMIEVAK